MVKIVETVGEPTGVIETTSANLDPVLAQLRLVSLFLAYVGLRLIEGLFDHCGCVEVLWHRHENGRVDL